MVVTSLALKLNLNFPLSMALHNWSSRTFYSGQIGRQSAGFRGQRKTKENKQLQTQIRTQPLVMLSPELMHYSCDLNLWMRPSLRFLKICVRVICWATLQQHQWDIFKVDSYQPEHARVFRPPSRTPRTPRRTVLSISELSVMVINNRISCFHWLHLNSFDYNLSWRM